MFSQNLSPVQADNIQASPLLVQLDELLNALPNDQSFKLKEELLVAVTSDEDSIMKSSLLENPGFFAQKPISFDQMTGSIDIPCIPKISTDLKKKISNYLQFCVRDSNVARKELKTASLKLRSLLSTHDNGDLSIGEPLGLLLLGSLERGNKLFRYSGWESLQLYQQLQITKRDSTVPVVGLYANGVFAKLYIDSDSKSIPAVM